MEAPKEKKTKDLNFVCTDHAMVSHVQSILNGEYDPHAQIKFDENAVIYDIGACYGAFTFWHSLFKKWNVKECHCFEPNPEVFKVLEQNMEILRKEGVIIKTHNVAVIGSEREEKTIKLYMGKYNVGEATTNPEIAKSMHMMETEKIKYVNVPTIKASEIGFPTLVKIDTEGCEVEIIKDLIVKKPLIIILEYHSEEDRDELYELLKPDYRKIEERGKTDRGILIYILRKTE